MGGEMQQGAAEGERRQKHAIIMVVHYLNNALITYYLKNNTYYAL